MSGTIAQNISRFYPDADEGLIIEAAKAAGIHDLVLSLPAGYQTHVGERGTNLSAGQRQRIALARAIYGHPKLVVMDEPNSNLDSEGEAALVEAIKNMRAQGVTVIVVAHRPSALAVADLILVLIEGQVAAFGDRDEVLQKYFRPVRRVASGQTVSLVGSD
jgi:ABC-type protease/lipase transport system fused ATPase/permease subunit